MTFCFRCILSCALARQCEQTITAHSRAIILFFEKSCFVIAIGQFFVVVVVGVILGSIAVEMKRKDYTSRCILLCTLSIKLSSVDTTSNTNKLLQYFTFWLSFFIRYSFSYIPNTSIMWIEIKMRKLRFHARNCRNKSPHTI